MTPKTILVFAGAGASKAVQPDQYPTTLEFFQRLPSEVTTNPLFVNVNEFLREQMGKDTPIDIEVLLWRLEELQTFCARAVDSATLPGWMIRGNRLAKTVGHNNHDFGQLNSIATTAAKSTRTLIATIHKLVYDLYGPLPDESRLAATWIPLLQPLIKTGVTLELVTTNYDMILETALDRLNTASQFVVDAGWRGTVVRTLDTKLWNRRQDSLNASGLLTKLHGSVNWSRDGDTIYVSDPMFKGSHERHVIIYPGFKGRPTDPIFQGFHNHFADALSRASGVVFVGFAFRDDHINDLCDRSLPTTAKVVVIDPAGTVNHPFRHSDVVHLTEGFDQTSATKAAQVLIETIKQVP